MNDTQVSPAFAGRFQQVCLYIEAPIAGYRSIAISSGYVCVAPVGDWRLIHRKRLSILPLMRGSRILSRSAVPSAALSRKAPASSVNSRTGWNGIDACRNIRYRSNTRWMLK